MGMGTPINGMHKSHLVGGGAVVSGIVAFTTTGATVEVNCGGFTKISGASALALGTPASDEVLSFNETATAGEFMDVPTSGTITLTRTGASKTSGLKVSVVLFGF